MNIIVPMAGMGKRMRPHTLTIPKPLIPVAGKPIAQHLVEDIAKVCNEPLNEIAFVVGRFGKETEDHLLEVAKNLGAKGRIYYQDEALGTAHAILCAKDALKGKVIVAFADTLFKADFNMNDEEDGVLWVQQIKDPSAFGVVKLNKQGYITDFVEKPKEFVSDLAMIGIYYFKDGENLKRELQYLIDNNIMNGGEYQLPEALKNMTAKGLRFTPGKVEEWLDCGNKDATVYTNQRILKLKPSSANIHKTLETNNSIVVPPCFIGEDVVLNNSVIGPYVSIGKNSVINNSVISNSIINSSSNLNGLFIEESMIGNFVNYVKSPENISIGDYSTLN